jgi:outer membrane protein assembly factor BamD
MKNFVVWGILGVAALCAAGCGSSTPQATLTPEERFAKAKTLFEKEDYLEAINEFTVLTLQYQGSSFAADAQYYLGECRFQRGEFLLAAYEYSVLKRSFPASARVADGQYKLALCYYNLAPKSNLDQQYTRKAIDEFQSFVEYYPAHSLAADADQKIKELNGRLAKKQYDSARLYARMAYYRAALISYDVVIEKYHDTEYAPLSYIGKAEILMARDRYAEAATEIEKFLDRFPNSVLRSRAEDLKRTIEKELGKQQKAGSAAGTGNPLGAQPIGTGGGSAE